MIKGGAKAVILLVEISRAFESPRKEEGTFLLLLLYFAFLFPPSLRTRPTISAQLPASSSQQPVVHDTASQLSRSSAKDRNCARFFIFFIIQIIIIFL